MGDYNNMMCDINTGVCGVSDANETGIVDFSQVNPVLTLYYVTDPICSHCWALEPVLNRFVKQYGHYFNFQVVMGGLLPSWEGFADRANGIGKPSDVAAHWKEVGQHTRMPISGEVWLTNPIQSSFPPSRVFKIIQRDHPELAHSFLRQARLEVFVHDQNIAQDDALIRIINRVGLDGDSIVKEAKSQGAQDLLNQDFDLARDLGVRGFPTIIMMNKEKKGVKIVGARELGSYVDGLQKLTDRVKPAEVPSLDSFISDNKSIFSKEIEVMYDIEQTELIEFVEKNLKIGSYKTQYLLGELQVQEIGE